MELIEKKVIITGLKTYASKKTGATFEAVSGIVLPEGIQIFSFVNDDSKLKKNKFITDPATYGQIKIGLFSLKVKQGGNFALVLEDVK